MSEYGSVNTVRCITPLLRIKFISKYIFIQKFSSNMGIGPKITQIGLLLTLHYANHFLYGWYDFNKRTEERILSHSSYLTACSFHMF